MKFPDWLLDLLYPRRCAFCHRLSPEGRPVCKACADKLPYTRGGEQRQRLPEIPVCVSPLFYEEDVRRSLLRYKFGGRREYAKVYGEFLTKCIDENEISCDIITWTPLSRKRLRKRGYDQARLLAEEIAAHSGVPCRQLLVKLRDNPAQSGTGSAEKRRANVLGVYACPSEEAVKGRRILLVDDIVTTGATLSECAKVLRRAGAASVSACTLARRAKQSEREK